MIRHVRNWPSYLVHKVFTPKTEFTFRTKRGKICVPPMLMHTFKECFFESRYFFFVPKECIDKENPVIVDVGANVGYFSLFVLNELRSPRVYSYEPIGRNFSLMKRYADELGDRRWHIENKAVAGETGYLDLHFEDADAFTTSASVLGHRQGTGLERVECETLEQVMDRFGLDAIDLLKLDCEGAEYEILYGAPAAVLKKIRSIAMETHRGKDPEQNRAALEKYLAENGFRTRIDRGDFLWAWRLD